MAMFQLEPPSPTGFPLSPEKEESEASLLLANALKKMDGLIGDYTPVLEDDPLTIEIAAQCESLKALVVENEGRNGEGGEQTRDPRGAIPMETKELLASWLGGQRSDSPLQAEQLQRDKEELLRQVISLQEQLENTSGENEKLSTQVSELKRQAQERDYASRSLVDDLRNTRATLQAREAELRRLQEEVQTSLRGNQIVSPPLSAHKSGKRKRVTMEEPDIRRGGRGRGSIRKTLVKAFGRKKAHTATLHRGTSEETPPPQPTNHRAAAFFALSGQQLIEWFHSIGLEMYVDLVQQNIPSGEKLATITSSPTNEDLVRVGILSTLHCKKLRLAVEDALAEQPSPLEGIDHHWVAEWLVSIGLPQYQHTFQDARIDCRMLNYISMDDLYLLDVGTPFHIVSMRRAIQAFRMCGYNPNYLKKTSEKSQGSQKLLHWSVQDVMGWVRSIELEEYVAGIEDSGIHGAVMLLDVQFTSESLARVLGIAPTKTLLRKHLTKKFMEVIGPVGAQKKLDAIQSKVFQPLDPTERPKGHRARSRSVGSKRGKHHKPGEEELLCPLEEFPPSELVCHGHAATPPLDLPSSPLSPVMRVESPPTP